MNSRVDAAGAIRREVARGASGREIALRFNRALLLVGFVTLAAVLLIQA